MSKLSKICQITHNVGNIRYSGNNSWIGQCGEYKGFVKFIDQIYSIRALVILLRTYINIHGDCSVESIINRYAPSSENITQDYISYVSDIILEAGGNPDFIVYDSYTFFSLCKAICFYETNFVLTQKEFDYVLTRFNL